MQLARLRITRPALRQLLSTSARSTAPAVSRARASQTPSEPSAGAFRRPLPPLNRAGELVAPVEQEQVVQLTPKKKKTTTSRKAATPKASTSKLAGSEASDALEEGEGAGGEGLAPIDELPGLETAVRRNLARYPDALLLTQVGSFFESYFDQAPLVARALGIKLTTKLFGRGESRTRYPTCGFPISQLSKQVSVLVEAGHKVVVVEEYRPLLEDGTFGDIERRVTRIITAGTGVDEGFVRRDQMNFVLAVGVLPSGGDSSSEDRIGLAYRDISTGVAFTRESTLDKLRDDLLLIEPKEVVVELAMEKSNFGKQIWDVVKNEADREAWMISTTSLPYEASHENSPSTSPETWADQLLRSYLGSTLLSTPPPSITPTRFDPKKLMQMDSTTLQSLEIRGSLRGGVKGSLMSTVRRTVTPGGARLLAERLCAPSIEVDEINSRLSLVTLFHESSSHRAYLRALLKTFEDTSRILQRLFLRRGSAFDLLYLKRTILGAEDIRETVQDCIYGSSEAPTAAEALLAKIEDHSDLAQKIESAIDEEALVKRTEQAERRAGIIENLGVGAAERAMEEELELARGTTGLWGKNEAWVVKPGFSPALTQLHAELESLRREADQLEKSLRDKYEIKVMTLKTVAKLGPVLHVAAKNELPQLAQDPTISLVGRSGSTRTYIFPAWSQLSAKIDKTSSKLRDLESHTVSSLIAQVLDRYPSLQRMSDAIDELDVSLGFAELAREMDLTKPLVNDGTSLQITEGRHPSVELSLKLQGREFQTNSVHLSHPEGFVHVITGPNMGGKSTLLRSTAIIAILAQAGSFVPAARVEMGVVDRVYSRVGARDELDRDRSTFMVEMDEATSILRNATDRSLVLFDELGRGTSPLDGLAIAYAALEHIVNVNRSRTLFATHYHKLGELMGCETVTDDARGKDEWRGVEFWCTDVVEHPASVEYIHTVRRGLNSDSAGLIVARLSGMPARVIDTAQELRKRYQGVL